MVIQFTLQDLLLFLGCVLLGVVGIFLVSILFKVNKMMGTCRTLLDSNQDSIKRTIQSMPGIMENTEKITENVKDTTDKVKDAAPGIIKDAEYVSHAAKNGAEVASAALVNVSTGVNETVDAIKEEVSDISTYVHIASEIIKIIIRAFSSGK